MKPNGVPQEKKYSTKIFKDEKVNVTKYFNTLENSKYAVSKYIHYDLNKEAGSFADLFKTKQCNYIEDNYKANSCFVTAIVNRFHDDFDVIKSDGKRMYKELTYNRVCEIKGLEQIDQDLGLTITQAVKFFETFLDLGLMLLIFLEELYSDTDQKK